MGHSAVENAERAIKSRNLNARIPQKLWDLLAAEAKEQGRSIGKQVQMILQGRYCATYQTDGGPLEAKA